MKDLTYEELKPWFTVENRLWIEDDATRNTEGHQTISQAWVNIFGCNQPHREKAIASTDWGDAGGYIFDDGLMSFWSFDGNAIYRIPEEGMQVLGLRESLPYSSHTDEQTSLDPKGAAAAHKAPLHLLPPYPLHETAHVMKHGAEKYGPWNWRENKVAASVYRSAMQRHLDQWFDGLEDADAETGRSHLAHVIANACIVMDAMKHGTLVDDRPRVRVQGGDLIKMLFAEPNK